jgi:hypothetical protein
VTGYSLPKPKTNLRASHDFSMTIFVIDPTLRVPQGHSPPALSLTIFFNSLDCQILPPSPAGTGVVPGTPEGTELPLPPPDAAAAAAAAATPFQLPKTSTSSFLPFAVGDVVHFQDVKVQEYKDLPQLVTLKGSNITVRHYQCDHISGVRKSSLSISDYKLLSKAFGDSPSKTKKTFPLGAWDAWKKGQSFQIKHYPSMHCIASAFQTISDTSVESNEELELQLSRYGDAVLLSESLSDGLQPHTDLHSIASWTSTYRSLKANMPTSPHDVEDSHLVRINGMSLAGIISGGGLHIVPTCDTVCLYTGCRQSKIGDTIFTYMKLWDGSNHGTTTVSDCSSAHLAVKYATLFAGTKDTEQLKVKEQQAIALLLEQAARSSAQSSSSSSSPSSSSSSSSSVMLGEEVEVVLNPQISPTLTDKLLPGTWLRIRNLHLTLEKPSIHFDTHVCTLKPYYRSVSSPKKIKSYSGLNRSLCVACVLIHRDVSTLIEKYSARVLADRQKSAAQAQRNIQFNALTHNSVGHPFTVLVRRTLLSIICLCNCIMGSYPILASPIRLLSGCLPSDSSTGQVLYSRSHHRMVAYRYTQVRMHSLFLGSVSSPLNIIVLCYVTRRFLVHYDPDTYSHVEPKSGLSLSRKSRTSGIFFVLKVQGKELVHCCCI